MFPDVCKDKNECSTWLARPFREENKQTKSPNREFPSDLVVRTEHFYLWVHPWSGNCDPTQHREKKKKNPQTSNSIGLSSTSCVVRRWGFPELGNGAVRFGTFTSERMQEDRECVCPAKYFLHYTANPISSFRKLCNVNSRAPFIEQLGPCLPTTPILLTANKMHTEGLSLPEEWALAS